MADLTAPHFNLPFQFKFDGNGGSVACVEQDTMEDLGNVAYMIMATPLGYRDEALDFGTPDLVFREYPVIDNAVRSLIQNQDSRIEFAFEESSPASDELIRKIKVGIAKRSA